MRDGTRKITVEDLLRLKRAERPPAEFWSRFDSEMRAKQLAAIVVRRPWWDGLSRFFAGVRRHQLPLGAAAALMLTWTGVHFLSVRPTDAVQAAPVRPAEAALAAATASAPAVPVAFPAARPAKPQADLAEAVMEVPAAVPSTPSHLTKMPEAGQVASLYGSPFAQGIAVTLADFRSMDSEMAKSAVFGSDREFEAPAAAERQAVTDPLTRVDPAGDRLQRLLAPALPVYSTTANRTIAGDRLRGKVSDDRMYESMDRYGSGGMSLEFRF
jgi:hypothetical protein